jgi:hypothetical protein
MNAETLTVNIGDDQVDQYEQNGILQLSMSEIQTSSLLDFRKECCAWLKYFGGLTVNPDNLAHLLPSVASENRQLISKLYKVARRFPSVKRLASDPALVAVSAKLMRSELPACCHFINVRIDLPGEEKYLLPPHQDFPYIQDSANGVVWWIPFFDVLPEMGPPAVVPGSHKLGLLKVREFDYESTGRSGGKSFQIADEQLLSKVSYAPTVPVHFGQALVFSTLLLHRSQPNLSEIARLSVQVRVGDALAQDCFDRNYPEGLYLGDKFEAFWPEYVVS